MSTASHAELPPGFDADRLDRLAAFAEEFRAVFPRSDQFLRFQTYLAGLLTPGDRKNVESIATCSAGLLPAEADPVQALQHFITRSPWDADRLMTACRRSLAGPLADPQSVWVIYDAVFPKKGRHSVGVQRQFARSLGRKVNCQIGVVLGQLGPNGYFPLAARLYLPAVWLRENREQVERTVPVEYRRPASKGEIASALIDVVRAEGRLPGLGKVVPEGGYAASHELIESLASRGLTLPDGPGENADRVLEETQYRFDDLRGTLGLDHFEGRTWVGWHHHVSLVFAAFAFLVAERSVSEPWIIPPPAPSLTSC